jgi:hypothetical protein
MHSAKFERPDSCDLLICDEAHRLKNDQTLTNKVNLTNPNQIPSLSLWHIRKFCFYFVRRLSSKYKI